ncbi:MAG: hypothetical protein QG589_343 [Patescibacteria group bacterium]|nr:hypothetical protein [Patescibacteria group bacterium]
MNENKRVFDIIPIKQVIEKYSPKHYSIILAVPVVLLGLGFIIWSFYLYSFGFTGNELFQGQYIITGLVFLLISLIITVLVIYVVNILEWIAKKIPCTFISSSLERSIIQNIKIPFYIFVVLTWFIFYISQLFPFIPFIMGGGQPRAFSLITTSENMKILKSFNINLGDGATYQTENLCLIYQDSKQIYIAREERVLTIDQSLIQGFASLPGPNSVLGQKCIDLASSWSQQGLYFGNLLLRTTMGNFFRKLIGKPKIYFDIVPVQLIGK